MGAFLRVGQKNRRVRQLRARLGRVVTIAGRDLYRFLFLLTILFFSSVRDLYARQSVTLGIILFPPNTRYDSVEKACVGESIDMVRYILWQKHIHMNVVCGTAARIYKLLETDEIDFTFNIKSTGAVAGKVTFVEPAFRVIRLRMYSRGSRWDSGSVAAIQGFDYNGLRKNLTLRGYTFLDLPSTISALKVFQTKQSEHLLAYAGPIDYYLNDSGISFASDVTYREVFRVNSYIAINNKSQHLPLLLDVFGDYARDNQLHYFMQHGVPAIVNQ